MAPRFTYLLDGVPLDDTGGRWKMLNGTYVGSPGTVVVNDSKIPGMSGAMPSDWESADSVNMIIEMLVKGDNYTNLTRRTSAVASMLLATQNRRLERMTENDETMYTTVRGGSTTQPELNPTLLENRFQATLRMLRPYWYLPSSDWTATTVTSGTTYTVYTLAGGDGPVTDIKFLLTGPMNNVTISDGDSWMELGMSIAAGNKALIDCANWTVRYGTAVTFNGGGSLRSGYLHNSGDPYALVLRPKITGNDPEDTTYQFKLVVGSGLTSASQMQVRADRCFRI